jgi:asparagine synthase (glutamine-hydrolysing)
VCGFAGVVRGERVGDADVVQVQDMVAALAHRGPDQRATRAFDGRCVLGTARLSIVDVAGSAQPLATEDRQLQLVYNGEIYNFRQLRESLSRRGFRFRTNGDGEVLLALYRERGLELTRDLDGMFAFALWDGAQRRLVLGRDRAGIKPLYYRVSPTTGDVVFASELPALLAHPDVPLEVDAVATAAFTVLRYCPPPGTPVVGVRKVAPGTVVTVDGAGLRVRAGRGLFDVAPDGGDRPLGDVLRDAVLTTFPDDRPAGVFLSGGLDSGSVLALAAGADRDVTAYSVGYTTSGRQDERPMARKVAAHLGVPLAETVIGDAGLPDVLRRTVAHLGEPVYTPVTLSTFAVGELAGGEQRVVLTGDGSDEVLVGYDHYRRVAADTAAARPWAASYADALGWLDAGQHGDLLLPDARAATAGLLPAETGADDPVDRIRVFELTGKLPEYHLNRVDRSTMAHGLEARIPFLRDGVADWALSRPARTLAETARAKQALREAQASLLPSDLLTGPKQKFSAPVADWLAGPLRQLTAQLLDAAEGAEELGLEPAVVRRLAAAHSADPRAHPGVTWGVMVLLGWYQWCFRAAVARRAGAPGAG